LSAKILQHEGLRGHGYKAPCILIYTTSKIRIPEQTCSAKDISLQTSGIKQTIMKAQLLK